MTDENITVLAAGVEPGSRFAEIVAGRADIMALTHATTEAIVHPHVVGGISTAERAALACRIARLNGDKTLAEHYIQLIPHVDDDAAIRQIADPSFSGGEDTRLAALIRHVDLVTQSPKDATREHIVALKDAGIAEADIVRLAEISAFINYQVRVIAGLRLLGEIA